VAPRFTDRKAAGRELAACLGVYAGRRDVVVLGLPRGGVPVAFEVAASLRAPLDVLVVRKLGVPDHEELAFGAVAWGGAQAFNHDVMDAARLRSDEISALVEQETSRVANRVRLYRGVRGDSELPLDGRTAIVVDDGIATGATMRAAILTLRKRDPAAVVIAVPVAPTSVCSELRVHADQVVCICEVERFGAVGLWYGDFAQTTDGEVRKLLGTARGSN
jgi:putative phosphoribosyl transferase